MLTLLFAGSVIDVWPHSLYYHSLWLQVMGVQGSGTSVAGRYEGGRCGCVCLQVVAGNCVVSQ